MNTQISRWTQGGGVGADVALLVVTLCLMSLGLVMVYSASIHVALVNHGSTAYYLEKQSLSGGLAVGALLFGMLLPYRYLRQHVYLILGICVVLLIVILLPGIGTTAGKSTRWLRLPGFSIQPSELGKVAFVVWLAYSLEKKSEQLKSFTVGFLPHLVVAAFLMGLFLMQPDLGVCIVLALVMVATLFVAGTRVTWLIGLGLLAVPVLIHAVASNSMRLSRILAFLDPWEHRYDSAYALVNSMAAMGSGGLFGRGLGAGMQKFGYIPEAQTDFIFPVLGEELGLIGTASVVLGFAFIVFRGVSIAMKARDDFSRYLAFGLTMLIGVQAAINMGVSTALLPTKGLTLPFVSYGGTSLIVCAFIVGVLLHISADARAHAQHEQRRSADAPRFQGLEATV